MENDEAQRGILLSRRDALKILGISSASLLASCVPGLYGTPQATSPTIQPGSPTNTGTLLPACIVRPELTEGPYFVDEELNRSDIRSDPGTGAIKPGTPLTLRVPGLERRERSLQPARRRKGGRLALRCFRRLLRRIGSGLQYQGSEVSTRLPTNRCEWEGDIPHDLSQLVLRPHGPYSLQDPSRCGRPGARLYLPTFL